LSYEKSNIFVKHHEGAIKYCLALSYYHTRNHIVQPHAFTGDRTFFGYYTETAKCSGTGVFWN